MKLARSELDARVAELAKQNARGSAEPDSPHLIDEFAGVADEILEAASPEDHGHVWSQLQCILRDNGLVRGRRSMQRSTGLNRGQAPSRWLHHRSSRGCASTGSHGHMSERELITPHEGDSRYVRRDENGRFDEQVDVGRSQKQDKAKKAKHEAKPGQGDRGDQKR